MDMTRERLESYRSNKDEIKELQYKLDHLGEGDSMIDNSTVFDYSTGYKRPQSVIEYNYKRENRLRTKYIEQITHLQQECTAIELWIEEIPDGLTRRIFRMYFMDGMTQQAIAKKVHVTQSVVSKKIAAYLQME